MSEYKYACPVCGQHMMCDSSQAGTVMECPTCFQKITAPQAPTGDDQKFVLTGTKMGERRRPLSAQSDSKAVPTKNNFPGGVIIGVVVIIMMLAAYIFRGNFSAPTTPPSATSAGNSVIRSNSTADAPVSGVRNDIALNKPAFASSQQIQNPVQSGNDGNTQTRWCASNGSVPQWWEVDLGSPAVITNAQIIWERDSAYQYVIQVSSDNIQWTKLIDRTANAMASPINSDDFSASGRYVRIVVTGLAPGAWASFYEFRVFGSNSHPANQP
jgi:DNA-directed RNA polymerase subunit RPC12/RpoP